MKSTRDSRPVLRVGDMEGLGQIYSEWGGLIPRSGETILKTAEGWDMDVSSPWRKFLPGVIFAGFGGEAASKLYVTTERIVLVRDIDTWRELKEELSPLGVPAAAAKEVHLRNLKQAGARQFCEVWPRNFRVVKMKRRDHRWSWLDLRLVGADEKRYEIIISKTDGLDPETLTLIQSQFRM